MTDSKADRYGMSDSGLDGTDSDVDESSDQNELPHRVRHDSPKTNRSETQFLLSDRDDTRLSELEAIANQEFNETVYITDIKLAALRAGLNATNELFLEEMEAIGYGYFD